MSTSGSVGDLMRNIPSVQVDVEGHVSLRGSENVNILIGGKPSTPMNARTRADVLRQMPASEIERSLHSRIPCCKPIPATCRRH